MSGLGRSPGFDFLAWLWLPAGSAALQSSQFLLGEGQEVQLGWMWCSRTWNALIITPGGQFRWWIGSGWKESTLDPNKSGFYPVSIHLNFNVDICINSGQFRHLHKWAVGRQLSPGSHCSLALTHTSFFKVMPQQNNFCRCSSISANICCFHPQFLGKFLIWTSRLRWICTLSSCCCLTCSRNKDSPLFSLRGSCWDMTEHFRRRCLIKTLTTGISGKTSEVLINYPSLPCFTLPVFYLFFTPYYFGLHFRGIFMGEACSWLWLACLQITL